MGRSSLAPSALLGVALSAMLLAEPVAAEELSLRVASYNVWDVPMVAPDREARVEEIAHRLADLGVDVVALQELWVPEDAEFMAEVLSAAGLGHARYFGPSHEHEKGSGLFVASRHPIESARFEAFEVGTTPYIPWHVDWMADKGIAVVRITTPVGPVDVANTHLHASYAVGDYSFVQLSQALQIADRLAQLEVTPAGSWPPLLLMGDLNVDPLSLPLRALVSRAAIEPACGDFELDHVFARSGTTGRLVAREVSFLFRDEVRFRNGLERTLSDHPCVVAHYALSSCSPCGSTTIQAASTSEVAGAIARALDDERASTARFMRVSQIFALAVMGLALWLPWRLRRRSRRVLGFASLASLALAIVGAWLFYVGWHFAPVRLAEIAATQSRIPDR